MITAAVRMRRIGTPLALVVTFATIVLAATPQAAAGTEAPLRPRGPQRTHPIPAWNPVEWGVGSYIWAADTRDKQTCHLWRSFEVARSAAVTSARLRVLADNAYVVLLDGRELGRGSDYYYMTEYDITDVLAAGPHTIAISAFNETHEAGVVVGLEVDFETGPPLVVMSDSSLLVVPDGATGWERRIEPDPAWPLATEAAAFGASPWLFPPLRMNAEHVASPAVPAFWRQPWFQLTVAASGALALAASLMLAARLMAQSQARMMLDRERARIARDIHDELGSGLTQLVLEGEVCRTEHPVGSAARDHLEHLCERARALAGALDELVWAVNSRRDTLRDFIAFACKYVRRFLEPTTIRCRLDIDHDLPNAACDLPVRRNLLLAVKEAVNNAVKYSSATQLYLRVERRPPNLLVTVDDDGLGFDLDASRVIGNGLRNMVDRMRDIGGTCRFDTAPGRGCRVILEVPLAKFVGRAEPSSSPNDLLSRSDPSPSQLLASSETTP